MRRIVDDERTPMIDYGKPQRETTVTNFRRADGLVVEQGSRRMNPRLPPTRPMMTQVPSVPSQVTKPQINKTMTPMRADLEAQLAAQRKKPVIMRPPRPFIAGGTRMANDPPEHVGGAPAPGGTKLK